MEKKNSKDLCFTFIIGISLMNYLMFLQELGYKDTMEEFARMNILQNIVKFQPFNPNLQSVS